jgi:hypothetical protein
VKAFESTKREWESEIRKKKKRGGRETKRRAERQRERVTETQRDREAERQRDYHLSVESRAGE